MKLLESTKKLTDQTKNGENIPSLQVVEVVLIQCNLVDNQCEKSLKYYALLLLINFMHIC